MSTTFGINTSDFKDFELDEYGDIPEWINPSIFKKVAFRSNGIRWTDDLAKLLPDDTKVYPLDNSAQDIYTIGDIKREILEQLKK
jgi:hypothetical protein